MMQCELNYQTVYGVVKMISTLTNYNSKVPHINTSHNNKII